MYHREGELCFTLRSPFASEHFKLSTDGIFDTDVSFSDESENTVTATVIANEAQLLRFALGFAPKVTLLYPESLVRELKKRLSAALECYAQPEKRVE